MPREVLASHTINMPPHLQPQTAKERMDMTPQMTAWALENMPVARKVVMENRPEAYEKASTFSFANYVRKRPTVLPMQEQSGGDLADQVNDLVTRMYTREWRCIFSFILHDYSLPGYIPEHEDSRLYHGRADM